MLGGIYLEFDLRAITENILRKQIEVEENLLRVKSLTFQIELVITQRHPKAD